tara:strand:+ start:1886 stop:2647 length:762 start_codon:yes stop_codon:yes gene_type:complete
MQQEDTNISVNNNSTILVKIKNISFTVVLIMLSLGQWNDTKEAVVSAYEEVISRFTNEIEYKRINKLRIGLTEQYTEEILGAPQVIKPSKLANDVQYYYYNTDKFLLVTFIKSQRLSGFTVISKKSDFLAPIVYINKQLNSSPINEYLPTQDTILTNIGSLEYFSESYELSRNLMFYNFLLGNVNYSNRATIYSPSIIDVNHKLNSVENFDYSSISFPSPLVPNFYSITELSNDIMLESLLSNYEMNALFSIN